MLISYNIEKLKKAICDFHHLTGISIAVYDPQFNELAVAKTQPSNFFCNLVQSSPEGKSRCIRSDDTLLTNCAKCNHLLTHNCHAGLTDVAVPIFNNDILMGFILFGQVCEKTNTPPAFSEIYENIKDLGLDYKKLKRSYERLTFFDRPKINSAIEVVSMLTKYIWLENMIQPEFNQDFDKLLKYVETHLTEPLTVSELCRKFNFSKNALYKSFKQHFNCTVNEYVNRLRLSHAERLLKTTQLPIYEVCERCGINNYYHFCRLFKKEKGITPLQFRKQYLNKREHTLHTEK